MPAFPRQLSARSDIARGRKAVAQRGRVSRNPLSRFFIAGGRLHPFLRGMFDRLSVGSHWNNEQILREEIFSIERLGAPARSLARAQTIPRQSGFRRPLNSRLKNNEKTLLAAYRSIAKAVDEG